jgi:hypothetical protein
MHVTVIPGNEVRSVAQQPGATLAKHLARLGIDVILDTVHAAGRSIDAALDSYIASRSTAILVMWAYRHTRIRYSRLEGNQERSCAAAASGFPSVFVPALAFIRSPAAPDLITPAGRTRGSHQSGG